MRSWTKTYICTGLFKEKVTHGKDKTKGFKKFFTNRKMVNNSRRHHQPPHHKLPKRKQQQKNNAAVPEDHKIYSTFKPVNAEENSGES